MLVGEPGIGKTALCEQFCEFVSASGGRRLVGHCYEEGSFRPPYQPFVEVFGQYFQESDIHAASAVLGSSMAELARMLPTLRERLHISPRPPSDPEEDRWRLLQAATDLLHSAAAHQPLVVVLEDLHDADRGTLDLLLYLARNLHGARTLVVGTYRDVAVDRAHPLASALTELNRASNVARMQLRGLSTDEVQRLLADDSQQTIPRPFAELVHRQTEGNPLFVHETLRFVLDTGLVERRDGALRRVGEQSLAGRIPEGLRDAVGKRLSRLSESTNQILSVASVIGREFHLGVLRQVLGCAEEELEPALLEASAAGIIEEYSVVGTTVTYHFCHAFFRQTLYEEIMAPRRIRLHQQVARTLEDVHRARLEEHAAELAEHYAFSSDTGDLTRAIHYGEVASRRATDVFAYGDAASQLERALVVLDLADPNDDLRRCDLLLALAAVLWPAGGTARVIAQVAPEALALAERRGDRGRAFRACRGALDCLDAHGASAVVFQTEYLRWAELAHGYADVDSRDRLYADLALALAWTADPHRQQEVRALRVETLALARQHNDAEALFRSAFNLIHDTPEHWDERSHLLAESTGWPRQGVSAQTLGLVLWHAGFFQLAGGDRARAEAIWRDVEELAEQTHVVSVKLLVPQRDIVLAVVDGHLEDALVQLGQYVGRADEFGASLRGRELGLHLLVFPALYLGRAEAYLTAFEEYARLAGLSVPSLHRGARAVCLAELGRLEEARALVGPVLDNIAAGGGDDEIPILGATIQLVTLLQAAVALSHRGAARALAARIECIAHLSTVVYNTGVARLLGEAAALIGDRAAARAYYVRALEVAGKIRFRPELALTRLRLAELLLEDADDANESEALAHLNVAVPELRDMQMQPALQRGLHLMQKLEHQTPAPNVEAEVSRVLTGREQEVARLVAAGRSNREIADTLVITEGTVEVHLKHILSKLGFKSRTQVASWLAEQRSP
jgi:DNA-binding CsgD family transcriptional regulator/tetratricopeptide (TPR) repeat protein